MAPDSVCCISSTFAPPAIYSQLLLPLRLPRRPSGIDPNISIFFHSAISTGATYSQHLRPFRHINGAHLIPSYSLLPMVYFTAGWCPFPLGSPHFRVRRFITLGSLGLTPRSTLVSPRVSIAGFSTRLTFVRSSSPARSCLTLTVLAPYLDHHRPGHAYPSPVFAFSRNCFLPR